MNLNCFQYQQLKCCESITLKDNTIVGHPYRGRIPIIVTITDKQKLQSPSEFYCGKHKIVWGGIKKD